METTIFTPEEYFNLMADAYDDMLDYCISNWIGGRTEESTKIKIEVFSQALAKRGIRIKFERIVPELSDEEKSKQINDHRAGMYGSD